MTMETSGGGEGDAAVASQSIRLILLEEAAHSVDDRINFDTWQAFPVIAGPLIAVTTGKSLVQDHMPWPVWPVPLRIGWTKESHGRRAHRGGEMQRSGISPHKTSTARHQGCELEER